MIPIEQGDTLIDRYIVPDPNRPGPERALIADSGLSVWTVISYLQATNWDVRRTAVECELSEEAVQAAILYYLRNQQAIDARSALHAAFHEA
ncbi:MAG TPA: hypothetical protein VFI42_01835 [Thermomicrobiaceae bacterium]|nr:hypothetical protein [Thermomicrobiaceae bacterium]